MQAWTPKEIEKFRKARRLTRRALGEMLGVTVTCVYQWERGLRTPNKTTKILLSRIADELNGEERKVSHGKGNL